jgi:Predicted membrane protein (DUF2207) C-terminal domain/Predicted membrane protein (DUF2207) N-terminal domain
MRNARTRWSLTFAALSAAIFLFAGSADAKSYSAERFDSVVRVLPDGTLDVTETVVFRFEDGTFREVFREIPLRRTDGIEVVGADIQGRRLPFGNETGTAEVGRRSDRIRVTWRFGPLEGVTREFVLNYRVRGAVRQDAGDLLVWRGTPGAHPYRIDSSTIRFELPIAPSSTPVVETRKAGGTQVSTEGTTIQVRSTNIGSNGWIDTTLTFPRRALASAPPIWQQHAAQVAAESATWLLAAGVVGLAGLILLFAWRQSYEAPPRDAEIWRGDAQQIAPPDTLAPPVVGVLAANGRPGLEHAMAALFSLADRGAIEIQEQARGALGQRNFVVSRRRDARDLAGYEQVALDTVFQNETSPAAVSLTRARSRLTRKFREFSRAITRELSSAGLLDESRRAIRDRYNRAGVWMMIAAAVGVVPAGLVAEDHGGWPMLIPTAIALVGVASFIFAATTTPLSNDGVRRAAHWRAYRKLLTRIAQGKQDAAGMAVSTVLPFAVALGLADSWSKFLKRRGHAAPAWFHGLRSGDDFNAFPAFIATGGAGMSSHGSSAASGAAGGGSSGAH